MGVTISCKKTGHDIDMGGGGFLRLRSKVADLVGEPFASHYRKLNDSSVMWLSGKEREMFFEEYDAETERLIADGSVHIKVADFLYQSDLGGSIHYGACKKLLNVIGDYDDNVLYGYAGRPDYARFVDFKRLLRECADNKCDLVWS